MQIGRITGLTEPHDWDSTGDDQVTVTADYQSTTVADGLTKRDQLLSYPTGDELAVPVILTSEPRSSGYYRPIRTQILTGQMERIHGHLFNYTVELQRVVGGFALPGIESIINGALLTNVVGGVLTDSQPFHAVPATVTEYDAQPLTFSGGAGRPCADGPDMVLALGSSGSGMTTLARYRLAPADFYAGAARFEQGSTLVPLVGRNLAQSDVVNWRLSNGIIRVTPNASPGKLDFSFWNGSSWSTKKTFSLQPTPVALTSLTVLRNSPEETIIRLGFTPLTGANGGLNLLDLALRRGDRLVRMYQVQTISQTLGLWRDTSEASTAIAFSGIAGGGIRATGNDADGNRFVMLSYQRATTADLVNGRLTTSAGVLNADFAVGFSVGAGGVVAFDTPNNLAAQYLAAQSEEQRIVSR